MTQQIKLIILALQHRMQRKQFFISYIQFYLQLLYSRVFLLYSVTQSRYYLFLFCWYTV